jgi:hypothetical protein
LESLAKDLQKPVDSTFLKDIKENKSDWVYDLSKYFLFSNQHFFIPDPNYEKNFVVYHKFKYEKKNEYESKLMKLGAEIAREVSGKKITEIDIIFPQKFQNS